MIESLNTYRMTTKGLTTDFFELDHMTSGLQKNRSGGNSRRHKYRQNCSGTQHCTIFIQRKQNTNCPFLPWNTQTWTSIENTFIRDKSWFSTNLKKILKRGRLDNTERSNGKISRTQLCIVDEPAISITTLETKARLMEENTDRGLIVLVNIHLMRGMKDFTPHETGKYAKSSIP